MIIPLIIILKNIIEELSGGLDMLNSKINIWEIWKKYKSENFDVTTSNKLYKQFNSFIQTIKLLEHDCLFLY